jgi:hypothetical protein
MDENGHLHGPAALPPGLAPEPALPLPEMWLQVVQPTAQSIYRLSYPSSCAVYGGLKNQLVTPDPAL